MIKTYEKASKSVDRSSNYFSIMKIQNPEKHKMVFSFSDILCESVRLYCEDVLDSQNQVEKIYAQNPLFWKKYFTTKQNAENVIYRYIEDPIKFNFSTYKKFKKIIADNG